MAQWLACWAHNPKVPGPKPGSAMFVFTQEDNSQWFCKEVFIGAGVV